MNVHSAYPYGDAKASCAHAFIWPALQSEIAKRDWPDKRAFDLGCGNGATANMLSELGFAVSGADPSEAGIRQANSAYPHLDLRLAGTHDDLKAMFGTFPLLVSVEVVEHVYAPRVFAKTAFELLEPGGLALITTPYHGYWKNLAIALTGKFDWHHTALWDGGHIKFWSMATLSTLLQEAGFSVNRYVRVGRIPPLAKSMIAIATRAESHP
jgi:2-polyprenyl-6-hydroxyphenyl methylase/3-demethylubiquinone-9 3-methyltransferase